MAHLIANARMYSAVAPAKAAWRAVFTWVLARAGVPMEYIDHDPPNLLGDLWSRDDLGATMMCGLPWALRTPTPTLIAAPVPSPARYGDRPVYFSDILVNAEAPYRKLEDTFGGTVGYTLTDSMSGCVALHTRLEAWRTPARPRLYAKVVGDLVHVRGMIEAIAACRVDVGAVDSYVCDLLRKHDPAFMAQVRSIGSTSPVPIPPVVATASLGSGQLEALQEAFLEVAVAPELAGARAALLLERFALPDPARYASFRAIHASSERYAGIW
jgi:ABC-type phosphate/phosphonate transport system substrate-binding protein